MIWDNFKKISGLVSSLIAFAFLGSAASQFVLKQPLTTTAIVFLVILVAALVIHIFQVSTDGKSVRQSIPFEFRITDEPQLNLHDWHQGRRIRSTADIAINIPMRLRNGRGQETLLEWEVRDIESDLMSILDLEKMSIAPPIPSRESRTVTTLDAGKVYDNTSLRILIPFSLEPREEQIPKLGQAKQLTATIVATQTDDERHTVAQTIMVDLSQIRTAIKNEFINWIEHMEQNRGAISGKEIVEFLILLFKGD